MSSALIYTCGATCRLQYALDQCRSFCASHDLDVRREFGDPGADGSTDLYDGADRRAELFEAMVELAWGETLVLHSPLDLGTRPWLRDYVEREVTRQPRLITYVTSHDMPGDIHATLAQARKHHRAIEQHRRTLIRRHDQVSRLMLVTRPDRPPYGYKVCNGGLQVHRDEQAVIRQIMELRGQGGSYRDIAHRLTLMRIPTRSGEAWCHTTVRKIVLREQAN